MKKLKNISELKGLKQAINIIKIKGGWGTKPPVNSGGQRLDEQYIESNILRLVFTQKIQESLKIL